LADQPDRREALHSIGPLKQHRRAPASTVAARLGSKGDC
jgi:hypothetical protein